LAGSSTVRDAWTQSGPRYGSIHVLISMRFLPDTTSSAQG